MAILPYQVYQQWILEYLKIHDTDALISNLRKQLELLKNNNNIKNIENIDNKIKLEKKKLEDGGIILKK